jgi:hypothetical protein
MKLSTTSLEEEYAYTDTEGEGSGDNSVDKVLSKGDFSTIIERIN